MINRKMNVLFDYPYRWQYYLTHLNVLFRHMWHNIRDAWQRINNGYCEGDAFSMDSWFMSVVPGLLREIAKGSTYTIIGEEGTLEEWHNWLRGLADRMEACLPENKDKRNEFAAEYYAAWDKGNVPNELTDRYLSRENVIMGENSEEMKSVLREMGEHFFDLWI